MVGSPVVEPEYRQNNRLTGGFLCLRISASGNIQ